MVSSTGTRLGLTGKPSINNRDCNAYPDDAEHVLLRYPRWAVQNTTLENVVGDTLTADDIIALVSAKDHTWGLCRSFCQIVVKAKQVQGRAKGGATSRNRS